MDINASIARLGVRLDDWFDGNQGTFASQDRQVQGHELLCGFELVKELDRLKSDGIAALTGLLTNDASEASNERVGSLMRGFEFSAKLADTLHDELLDTEGQTKVLHLMDAIVMALNSIFPGRSALTALFDDPNAGVRASAGAYLIDLTPDRVVPLLKEIDESRTAAAPASRLIGAFLAWKLDKNLGSIISARNPQKGRSRSGRSDALNCLGCDRRLL